MSRRTRRARRPLGPDRRRLLKAAHLMVAAIGEQDLQHDLKDTPRRFAAAWSEEILSGYKADPRAILGSGFAARDRGMVVIRDIPFVSICVHHLLPFHGTAHVAYLPEDRIVGLSKVARLVDALARRLQLQERLTAQITAALETALAPAGVACRMEAQHLCMTLRGARATGTRVVTTSFTGSFRRRPAPRAEFLRLTGTAPAPAPRAGRRR